MSHSIRLQCFLDRDVSWMYFNSRILQEANRSHVPLLERVTFMPVGWYH